MLEQCPAFFVYLSMTIEELIRDNFPTVSDRDRKDIELTLLNKFDIDQREEVLRLLKIIYNN